MGTMNKMRENTGVILWILVFAFGVIWVLQDSGGLDVVGLNPTGKIISVNGDPITYEEYNNALEARIEQYRQQTGESMPPQRLDAEHNRVFEALVANKLREHEMERLGITVSRQEVINMVLGENPHPIIKAYFGDGQGGVDRALLQNFIDDPEAEQQWVALEDYLRNERRRQKLDNLIAATVRVTDEDVQQEYVKRNKSVTAGYYALRYADIADDEVEITERDLERYYDEHREDFERKRSYAIKVGTLSKLPSAEDTVAALEDVNKLRPTFEEADDDSLFLARYASETPYSDAYFTRGDLDEALAEAIFSDLEPGRIVGPVLAGGQVHLAKIIDVRPAEEQAVHARHILIAAQEGNKEQRDEARQRAQEIKQQLQSGADFAELAQEVSDDPGSGAQGGDLGWFGPGRMVEPFEDAAFNAEAGQLVGPVESRFGFHLIEVLDRATQEVQLADYSQRLRASTTTLTDAEERLEDLAFYASESGDFEGEAQRQNLTLETLQVEADQQTIPGIGTSRSLMQFLADAGEGDISEVIELNDRFLVAYVEEITPEGYRPLEEVEAQLRPRVLLEKKKAIQREKVDAAFAEHGYEGLGTALRISERTAQNVSFNNMLVSTLGRDQIFAGTVLGLEEGEVSGVVEGENAVFVAQAKTVNTPPPITDAQREQLRNELLNRRRSQVQQQWIASLKEQADIEDLRSQLLR